MDSRPVVCRPVACCPIEHRTGNRRVVIYGTSLFMAALEAALHEQPGLNVLRLDPSQACAPAAILAHRPQIIFMEEMAHIPLDAATAQPNTIFPETVFSETILIVLSLQSYVFDRGTEEPIQHPIQNINELLDLLTCGR